MASRRSTRADIPSSSIHALKASIFLHSLGDSIALDARALAVLEKNSVLSKVPRVPVPKLVKAVLLDTEHPHRIKVCDGPMLFYRTDDKGLKLEGTAVADMLLSPDRPLRKAALAHFEAMVGKTPGMLTLATEGVIAGHRGDLLSTNSLIWRTAALEIADGINDDMLCNLAGVRQAVEMRLQDATYMRRVLSPSRRAVDLVQLTIQKGSAQKSEIEGTIDRCVDESDSLSKACARYYQELGHLPLDLDLSMGELVDRWIEHNGSAGDTWRRLWDWANSVPSPLPRYHACIAFIRRPDLIPGDMINEFIAGITDIMRLPAPEDLKSRWAQAWRVRHALARHYLRYLECHFPGQDGERLAGGALWLAEQLSAAFGTSPAVIAALLESVVEPESRRSLYAWELVPPPVQQSHLEYATIFSNSVWSLSLQCLLAEASAGDGLASITSDQADEVGTLLGVSMCSVYPLREVDASERTYAFERSIIPSAKAWESVAPSDDSLQLGQIADGIRDLADPTSVADALSKITEGDPNVQALITRTVRAAVHTRGAYEEELWQRITDEGWGSRVLRDLSDEALYPLAYALVEMQWRHPDKWISELPHFFAAGCERSHEDSPRHRLLFSLVVLSCLTGDSVSALERLVHGKHRQAFAGDVSFWRLQLQALLPTLPPWAASKVRGILPSLYPAQ